MSGDSGGGQSSRCLSTRHESPANARVRLRTLSINVQSFQPTNVSSCHSIIIISYKPVLVFNSYSLLNCQVTYRKQYLH